MTEKTHKLPIRDQPAPAADEALRGHVALREEENGLPGKSAQVSFKQLLKCLKVLLSGCLCTARGSRGH